MLEHPLILIFPLAMAFAASIDLFTMTIPNRVSGLLIVTFAIIALIVAPPWDVVGRHLMVAGAVFAVSISMFAMRWMGGGDAKLLTAASLWVGPELFPWYVFFVALLGGLLSLAILRFRSIELLPAFLGNQRWALRLHDEKGGIPYGVALGGSAMLIYPQTIWFKALVQ
jgi:prepilin peptidase CpaA